MKADRIDHLVQMLKSNVYHAYLSNMENNYGYLTQLKEVAKDGGYITEETSESMSLLKAVGELRRLANEIEATQKLLIENSKVPA